MRCPIQLDRFSFSFMLTTSILFVAIGFNCILTMSTKSVLSKLRGTTLALYILTLCRNSRFEFIFTNLAHSNARTFSSVFDVYRYAHAYISPCIYVDMFGSLFYFNSFAEWVLLIEFGMFSGRISQRCCIVS